MNSPSQLDLHPDAEALNAFAEHLLPEHELQPILAHLATCARCRQIVYLVQDTNQQDAPASAVFEPSHAFEPSLAAGPFLVQGSSRKPGAPAHRLIAWGALAAAALVTVSLLLYPHGRPTPPQNTARNIAPQPPEPAAPPSAASPMPATPSRPQQQRPAAGPETRSLTRSLAHSATRPTAPPASQRSTSEAEPATVAQASSGAWAASVRSAAPQAQASAQAPQITTSPAPIAQASQTVAVSAAAQGTPQSASQTVAVSNSALDSVDQPAPPSVTATIPTQPLPSASQLELKASKVKPLPVSPAIHGFAASRGGALSTSAGGLLGTARSSVALAKTAPQPLVVAAEDEAAARNTLQKILPSGLPAVSAVSASRHLLALDSAGTLFLSLDGGAVWENVPQPWIGQATRLSLQPAGAPADASSHPAEDSTAPPATNPKPPPPQTRFEIMTSQGASWTSTDGRTWKAR